MTRVSIRKKLQKAAGGAEFINKEEIRRCMGWGTERVERLVKGLDYITQGKTKQFDIDEIAERISEQVVKNGI